MEAPPPPPTALVTGGARGIGLACAAALRARGYDVTVVDLAPAVSVAAALRDRGLDPRAYARADVTRPGELAAAFEAHLSRHGGRLDCVVANAGVEETEWFVDAAEDGGGAAAAGWRRALDVNLTAAVDTVRLALRAMRPAAGGRRAAHGSVVVVGSTAGVFPQDAAGFEPYAAAKAGAVHLARSLEHVLHSQGVCVSALCPQFTDTDLVRRSLRAAPEKRAAIERVQGRLLTVPEVVSAFLRLVDEPDAAGRAMLVTTRRGAEYWAFAGARRARAPSRGGGGGGGAAAPAAARSQALALWASEGGPPSAYRRVEVHTLSPDFEAATRVATVPLESPPPRGHVLVRRAYCGVNASDINFSSGRYFGAGARQMLPFAAGFESVGVVAAVGEGAGGLAVGDPVATLAYGGFSEYGVVRSKDVVPVPAPTPEMLALLTSGLTASIGLEQAGRMGSGQTVLVTAAAGGTGQFAVQLAKLAGNRVVATCGSAEKAALLRELGADVVVDYRAEDVKAALKRECPKGVDVVYESVGGEMFELALNALAPRGRLVVIGMMSQYKDGEGGGWAQSVSTGLQERALWKSASVTGFFLPHYAREYPRHLARLVALLASGKLRVAVDPARFVGVESAAAAVAHLQSGASLGKVVVQVSATVPPPAAPSRVDARL